MHCPLDLQRLRARSKLGSGTDRAQASVLLVRLPLAHSARSPGNHFHSSASSISRTHFHLPHSSSWTSNHSFRPHTRYSSEGTDHKMERRAIDVTILTTIQSAWSSPSNCVKSNWCRIPSAIIIAIGLLILFTFFCCCAQCLSCCCCRPRKKHRGFGDTESGSAALLPRSTSYHNGGELPAMPSYKMDSLKKPTYAVIGDDGSVMTEDPEKRLREDFPSPNKETTADYTGPDFAKPAVTAPADIFSTANGSFHDTLLNQNLDTAYVPPIAGTNYPPSYHSGRASPPRRQQFQAQQQAPPSMAMNSNSYMSGPGQQMPRGPRAPLIQPPQNPKTSRAAFNEGGPFPLIGQRPGMNMPNKSNDAYDNRPTGARTNRLPSPPFAQPRHPIRQGRQDPAMDWPARAESPAPYPMTSPTRDSDMTRTQDFEEPFNPRHGRF